MSGIRMAGIEDIKAIHVLGIELLESSDYNGIKGDDKKFKLLIANLITHKHGQVYVVADESNEPQGFFIGMIDEYFFSQYRFATDIAVYVREGYRQHAAALYNKFIKWAKTKPKVVRISFAQSSGMGEHARWCRLMEHLGLTCVGSMYTMRVTPCQA